MAVKSRGRRRRGPRARYRVRDWAAYDRALAQRGDITVWVSPEAVAGWRAPAGRRTFSDAAIAAALTVRAVYRLALRQAEGLIRSIFALLGLALPVPDHTSYRAAAGCCASTCEPPPATALTWPSTARACAWRSHPAPVARAGASCTSRWTRTAAACSPAGELTRSGVHDTVPVPAMVPAMLARIEGRLRRVYGDGAYAGGPTYRAVAERRQMLPNAEGVFRPKAPDVRAAARLDPLTGRGRQALVVARDGRAAWARATGYGKRNAAEWTFSRLKRVLGRGLRSRSLDGQRAEAMIAVRALNRMAELGLPRAQRVA
jgi:DDE family transposase